MKISVVSPVYFGERSVSKLVYRLITVLTKITKQYEIILVEDGSPDNSWREIKKLCKKHNSVKGIKLSRNFGQHYAINCGLNVATGEWVIVMDCDLQDKPEEIPRLFEKAKEGFDIVLARRVSRNDSLLKKATSFIFYKVFGYLTSTKYDDSIANFGIYHINVIRAILKMKDKIVVFPILVQWVGFDKASISVVHNKRIEGKSCYTYMKLITLAFDIIISFSNKPLKIAIKLGLLITFCSLVVGAVLLYKYFSNQISVLGYTSLILSIWYLSGMIIFFIGILGIYLGRVFDSSKDRPIYIVKEKINVV